LIISLQLQASIAVIRKMSGTLASEGALV
jgi:hypothetical protein